MNIGLIIALSLIVVIAIFAAYRQRIKASMGKAVKTGLAILLMLWVLSQWIFNQVSDRNDNLLNVNTVVVLEWTAFIILLLCSTFIPMSRRAAAIYFTFIIANLVYIISACAQDPIYERNMGFHHTNYVPVTNPLIPNALFYLVFLIYLNYKFNKAVITSRYFSVIVYILAAIAFAAILVITKKAEPEIQRMMNFRG